MPSVRPQKDDISKLARSVTDDPDVILEEHEYGHDMGEEPQGAPQPGGKKVRIVTNRGTVIDADKVIINDKYYKPTTQKVYKRTNPYLLVGIEPGQFRRYGYPHKNSFHPDFHAGKYGPFPNGRLTRISKFKKVLSIRLENVQSIDGMPVQQWASGGQSQPEPGLGAGPQM